METIIKLNSISELNSTLFNKILNDIISTFGSVEISIKPKTEYKPELIKMINSVNEGSELYSFTSSEFDEITKKIQTGEIISKKNLKKVIKDEKGNFIST